MRTVEEFGGLSLAFSLARSGPAPTHEIVSVERKAEEIGGNKTELSRSDGDDADEHAIGPGDDPSLPQPPSNEDGGEDGECTRYVVKTQHGVNALQREIPCYPDEQPVTISRTQVVEN